MRAATRTRFVARSSGREASGPVDGWGDWLRGLQDHELARRDGRQARLSVHLPAPARSASTLQDHERDAVARTKLEGTVFDLRDAPQRPTSTARPGGTS